MWFLSFFYGVVLLALVLPGVDASLKIGLISGSAIGLPQFIRALTRPRGWGAMSEDEPVRALLERGGASFSESDSALTRSIMIREELDRLELKGLERWNLAAGLFGTGAWSVALVWAITTGNSATIVATAAGVGLFAILIAAHLWGDRDRKKAVDLLKKQEEALDIESDRELT